MKWDQASGDLGLYQAKENFIVNHIFEFDSHYFMWRDGFVFF